MLDSYLILKLLHIICAVVVAGTGTGIAFFMLMVSRSRNVEATAITTKNVVMADWIFTAPAVFGQVITGFMLMNKLGYSLASPWFKWVAILYGVIGVCWLPVILIQYRLKSIAKASLANACLHPEYDRWMRLWCALGVPAFMSILVIFILMVVKPLPLV